MADPISAILSLGLPLAQAGISAIGRGKARREHDKAYEELMSQNFGATASAINYAKNAVSGKAMQDAFAQMNKTMTSGLGALEKGGSRTAMQAGNVAEAGLNAQANLGLQMQNIQNQANQFVASQDFQGQQMKRGLEAQNVAGLAQREMQSQMGINQGLQALGRNALALGLGGGINWGGEQPDMNTSGMDGFIRTIPEDQSIVDMQNQREAEYLASRNQANMWGAQIDPMNMLFPVGGAFDNQQNPYNVLGMGLPFINQ